ncbi:hypothetical protein F4804DRAFT_263783 [Jackrogersella minutella]|nr:hypothetical protein F4804DRAFT_263783 [Jackrogersella minutella]
MAVDDVSAAAKARANDLLAYGQRQVDRVVSPPTRQKAYDHVQGLATEKPVLFSFIACQLALSLAPLLLFTGFAATTIAVSLISAFLFSIFWIGIATLFLVPTLFITFGIALLLWAWGAATFFAGRWIYDNFPISFDSDGKVVANSGGKRIIFEKKDDDGTDFDIKAEAAEVKE